MKDKLGLVAFAVLLVAVWGVGFLWVRGDLPGTGGTRPAGAEASTQARPGQPSSSTPSSPTTPTTPTGLSSELARSAEAHRNAKPESGAKIRPLGMHVPARRPAPQPLPPVAEFTMASFNVLGSTHTGPGGHHSWLASGPQRINGVLALIRQHGVSVLGMQEFQPNQRNAFRARARGWQMYPGNSHGNAGANSVAWDTSTWQLVRPGLIPIPYFNGHLRPMPYVLLRHKATGVVMYFSTFHNPASVYGPAQRYRTRATTKEIALFRRLEATGVPQFVTGDMNERAEYFCRVTEATSLKAAQGGSNSGPCRPPSPAQIDWIFGSPRVHFVGFDIDRSPLVRRTSDHPFVSTTVRVDAIDYKRAYKPQS